MGSLSITHWLIVLVIVILVFGTKRLGNVGKDLGDAVRGFRKGIRDDEAADRPAAQLRDETRRDSAAPREDSREPSASSDHRDPR